MKEFFELKMYIVEELLKLRILKEEIKNEPFAIFRISRWEEFHHISGRITAYERTLNFIQQLERERV